ncbi:MAG: hypothetical protein ACO22U_14970 [bacterium]
MIKITLTLEEAEDGSITVDKSVDILDATQGEIAVASELDITMDDQLEELATTPEDDDVFDTQTFQRN